MARTMVAKAAAIALVVACPALAQAQQKPAMSFQPASTKNYSNTRGHVIDRIVIHKVEGSLDACVSWFKNPAAKASAHYVVDAHEIVQMLDDSKRAWHAGNSDYNARAIAIENAGFTYRNDISDAHMKRLASLVAYLCKKHGIAADRAHIKGHDEVPDPNHPGKFGGSGQHDDPGPYFDWNKLITYTQQALGGTVTVPTAPTPPKPQPTNGNGGEHAVSVVPAGLNVRDSAWGTVIGNAPQDTAWVKTGKTDQGFIEVYFRGGHGWIHSSYVTGYSGPGSEVTVNDLNVRTDASASSTVIGHAHQGQVYAMGAFSADGNWVTIRFDQSRRWVYRSYTNQIALKP